MQCPKCQSERVNVQVVTEVKSKRKHGVAYWLLVGFWLEPLLWIFLTIPRLIFAVFGNHKKTVSKSHKECICQNCGHSWKL